jgi:precorrin-2 dehydrogenase/sirohydrochlorin ferrochelatase
MRYYPIHLDIQNRNCLVVGGGGVGTRKVDNLLKCGARVTVVSPEISTKLQDLSKTEPLTLRFRPYRSTDLGDMFLVIGATDNDALNQQISRDAEACNTLCNIADRPEVCNFILPSIVQRDDLVITISTSGRSPALAKKLRQKLDRQFGREYGDLLKLMGAIRKKLLSQAHEPEAHKPLFEQLIDSDLLDLIRDSKSEEINALLLTVLGDGYCFEDLLPDYSALDNNLNRD